MEVAREWNIKNLKSQSLAPDKRTSQIEMCNKECSLTKYSQNVSQVVTVEIWKIQCTAAKVTDRLNPNDFSLGADKTI
jgi:hypothetical protein